MIEITTELKVFCHDCGADLTEQIGISECDGITELIIRPCPHCLKAASNIVCADCGQSLSKFVEISKKDNSTKMQILPCSHCVRKAYDAGYERGVKDIKKDGAE